MAMACGTCFFWFYDWERISWENFEVRLIWCGDLELKTIMKKEKVWSRNCTDSDKILLFFLKTWPERESI